MKRNEVLFLALLLLPFVSVSQVYNQSPATTLLGSYGCITSPTARFASDRTLFLGMATMPERYQIITDKEHDAPENLINFSLMFLPFMEVSAHLIRPVDISENPFGIGDRSYKVRFFLLKEKEKRPALALGIHDPVSTNTRQGAVYLVSSKLFQWKFFHIDTHLGYGFDIQKPFWEKTHLFQDDGSLNQSHLKGIFAGVQLEYKDLSFMLEYDTEKINSGFYFHFLRYFSAGIYTLGFDRLSAQLGMHYRFGDSPLDAFRK